MTQESAQWRTKLEAVARALKANGINAIVAETGDEAREQALALIPKGASIGMGGSKTVAEIGLLDALRSPGYGLIDQYDPKLPREAVLKLRRAGLQADYFIAGSNAVTQDGKLVNVDGLGNRVAAFAFGPDKVIIVAGRNKIVKDVAAGLDRIRNIAAPANAKRLGSATPCAATGVCSDCSVPGRICNLTLVVDKQRFPDRMTVILVNQELGY
ncbi:MAG TPA: lactate utilization protein [bacterium]|nr:lactate utilization protein [bacterium]